ncbi:unnamed protein product [Orchesella dallaii]|uniref:AAA+ ATPase domain-containing protein n=1 Tax=Orchesella dallaii TaxID=48710 RepID=A0ABP1R9G1_9HEXA
MSSGIEQNETLKEEVNPIPEEHVEPMDCDEGEKASHSNERLQPTGLPCLHLEPKSSFSVMREDMPAMEATVYEATWDGNESDLTDLLYGNITQQHTQASPLEEAREVSDNGTPEQRDPGINRPNAPGGLGPIPINASNSDFGFGGSGDGSGGGGGGGSGPNLPVIMFKDCGGLEEQVRFIKTALMGPLTGRSNGQFKRFGLEPPKGILFYGPPGTGKTRLAQAIGNEVKQLLGRPVHFIYRKGNDVASKYFGESSENLRRVFNEAKQMKPTVLFFDELDGLCPSRDKPFIGEANVTIVTTMLGLMDELPKGEIFVIGATNRLESIDPALRRPGRFDKHLEFLPPTEAGRLNILQIHTTHWKTPPPEDLLKSLSEKTVGFSGADLSKLCSDSFDQALNKFMDANSRSSIRNMPFHELRVVDADWNMALSKMKPSASAVFGSTLYTPSKGLGNHVVKLVQSNIDDLREVLRPLLPTSSSGSIAEIRSVYILSESEVHPGDMDDMIMSSLFRSEELAKYPVYNLSAEVLSSVRWTEWPQKVNSAFSQALDSNQPSILYLPQVDELWNSIVNMRMATAVNLSQLLENMRGKKVLLIATGSLRPWQFAWDSPFKQVFKTVSKLEYPTEEERVTLFEELLANDVQVDENWSDENTAALDGIVRSAADATEDKEIGSVVGLYDAMKQSLALNGRGGDDAVTKMLYNIIGQYKINELLPQANP